MKSLFRIFVYLFSFFIFHSSFFISYGQSWSPVGTTWHYGASFAFGPPALDFVKWEVMSDTVVNGKNATYVYRHDNHIDGEYAGHFITYEDQDIIYLYNDSTAQFNKLYDFNASLGQTWTMEYGNCVIELEVIDLGFDTINSVAYKSMTLSYDTVGGSAKGTINVNRLHGGKERPLPVYTWICTGSVEDGKFYTGLRCYEDKITGQYKIPQSYDCDFSSVGIAENNTESEIKILPNPTSGLIILKSNEYQGNLEIVVRNYLGSEINRTKLIFSNSHEFQLNGSQGIYFIELRGDGFKEMRKVIKE